MSILHHTLISTIITTSNSNLIPENNGSSSNFDSEYQIKLRVFEYFWGRDYLDWNNGAAHQTIQIQDDYQTHVVEISKANTQYDKDSIIYNNQETSGYVDIILNLNQPRIPLISWTGNCFNEHTERSEPNFFTFMRQSDNYNYSNDKLIHSYEFNMKTNPDEINAYLENNPDDATGKDFLPSSYIYYRINESTQETEDIGTIGTIYYLNASSRTKKWI